MCDRTGICLFCTFLGVVFIPLSLTVSLLMKHPKPETSADAFENAPRGERLKPREDYIQALRDLPLASMPLGIYGERAAKQIERMNTKI